MSTEPDTSFRRFVTGHLGKKAVVASHAPPTRVFDQLGEQGLVFFGVCNSRQSPARIDRDDSKPAEQQLTLAPPPGGMRIRVLDIPPEKPGADFNQVFENIGAADAHLKGAGRRVLLNGATGGIGSAMAEAFTAAGATLMMASNEPEELERAAAQLPHARYLSCNVGDTIDLDRLIDATQTQLGGIDVLVCNAGISGPPASMSAVEPAARAAFQDQSRAPATSFHPHRTAHGGGSIVLTASLAGLRGNAQLGLYGITKAALIQLARNLAVEWGPASVRTNAIAPG